VTATLPDRPSVEVVTALAEAERVHDNLWRAAGSKTGDRVAAPGLMWATVAVSDLAP
jgi:hypothetical protein